MHRLRDSVSMLLGRDEVSVYLTWMPENCQISASMLVAGIIEGILRSNDIRCTVSSRKLDSEKEDKNII